MECFHNWSWLMGRHRQHCPLGCYWINEMTWKDIGYIIIHIPFTSIPIWCYFVHVFAKNIRYLRWNRCAWHSFHNTHQTFLAPCIRCIDHLCDSCRSIDVNPHFTAPGCRYYFKINKKNVDLFWRHKYMCPPLAKCPPLTKTDCSQVYYGHFLITMACDVITNWPRATHTVQIILIMVQGAGQHENHGRVWYWTN